MELPAQYILLSCERKLFIVFNFVLDLNGSVKYVKVQSVSFLYLVSVSK